MNSSNGNHNGSSCHDATPQAKEISNLYTLLSSTVHKKVRKFIAAGGTLEQALDLLYQGCGKDAEKQAAMKHLMRGFGQDEEGIGKENSPTSMMDSVFGRNEYSFQEDATSNIPSEKQPEHRLNELVSCMAHLCAGEISEENVDDFVAHVRYLASENKVLLAMVARVLSEFEHPPGANLQRVIFHQVGNGFEEEMRYWNENRAKLKDRENDQFVVRVAVVKSFVSAKFEVHHPMLESLIGVLLPPDDLEDKNRACAFLDKNCAIVNLIQRGLFGDDLVEGGTRTDSEFVSPQSEVVMFRSVFARSICTPEVTDAIFWPLFTAEYRSYKPDGETIHEVRRNTLCYLLSCINTVMEQSQKQIAEKMKDFQELMVLRKKRRETYDEIITTVKVCEELRAGSMRYLFNSSRMNVILGSTAKPVLASGLLVWAEEGLRRGDNESSETAILFTGSRHLQVIERAAEHFESLRGQALEIVVYGFERPNHANTTPNVSERLKAMFFSSMVKFIRLGMGVQLAGKFLQYANDEKVGDFYLRRFVEEIFDAIKLPFEDNLQDIMLKLFRKDRVRIACKRQKNTKKILQKFLKKANSKARDV